MNEDDLKKRTKKFALRILKLIDALPNTVAGRTVANQLARSGTSVAANYRAACRGRSKADFIAKLGIVEEEADESEFWLEMIIETEMLKPSMVEPLRQEAHELVAIFVSSRKSASEKLSNQKSKIENRKSKIPMNSFYEQAWLFDLVHQKPANGEQINFYERAVSRFGQPVLELASGTGNYLVTLAENDFDISGTEKFAERFNISREKAETRNVETNLYSADMRDFNLGQKFKLIFIAGNALQHLKTNAEVASCFASVKRHLLPNGRFIVEIFNPSVQLLNRNPNERFFVGEYRTDEGWVVITTTVNYDSATQINHIDWHYKNQYWKEEQTVSFTMRQFFPQELDALFQYNGFEIEAKYGDFDESAFSGNSPKQIIIASLAQVNCKIRT